MQDLNNKALKLEVLRDSYARSRDFKSFIALYSSKLPEIKNRNTNIYWSKKNFEIDTSKEKYPMAWNKLNIIAKWIKGNKKIKKILNIGFGSCNLEKLLQIDQSNYEWHGIDIAKESVSEANKRFHNATFTCLKSDNIHYSNNYFDCVIASEVLEHISPSGIFRTLREVNRITKKGGIFIASVPLNENLENYLKIGINPINHVRKYTLEILRTELLISGFKTNKKKYLYAYHNYYSLKSFLSKILNYGHTNNLIIESLKTNDFKKIQSY